MKCSDPKLKRSIDKNAIMCNNNGIMFIRKVNKKNRTSGEMYPTYRLVESYRNANGNPRQEVLLHLGVGFAIDITQWKLLTDRIESIISDQSELFIELPIDVEQEAQRIVSLLAKRQSHRQIVAKEDAKERKYQSVDLGSLQHQDVKSIGAEYVGHYAATQLQLPEILLKQGFSSKQVNVALASIISRLCAPASEYSTHNYLQNDSALDEVLGTDFSQLSLKSLYAISDVLMKHKEAIEEELYQNEKDLFNLKETITLFDITNTYFEGRSLQNSKAKYGRSKEKRADCKIVALGLVLDSFGFPKRSKIFPGNVSEPSTLEEMIKELKGNTGITVIMDAGIATIANIEYLKANKYDYIVVSRSHDLSMPETSSFTTVKDVIGNKVITALVTNEATSEVELYCKSEAKEAKAKEIITKTTQRYETELNRLAAGLTKSKTTKKYDKVLLRIGRLAEKYSSIAMLYDVQVTSDDEKNNAILLTWAKKENILHKKETGIYCLKSSRKDLDAKALWETYTMLTDLESAFRSLKTELGFRPVYHQKEERIDGHLFISILAYHLLHTIRYQLKQKGIHDSWDNLRKILRRQYRITSTLQLEGNTAVSIRKTSNPTAEQMTIYKALNISSTPGKIIKNLI